MTIIRSSELRGLVLQKVATNSFPILLGLDLGQRYVGVSKSNKYLTEAKPLEWIDYAKETQFFLEMQKIIEKEKPYAIIYGLPLDPTMDGIYEKMIVNLDKRLIGMDKNLQFGSFYEGRSTLYAKSMMREMSSTVNKDYMNKRNIDIVASTLILGSFIDYLNDFNTE